MSKINVQAIADDFGQKLVDSLIKDSMSVMDERMRQKDATSAEIQVWILQTAITCCTKFTIELVQQVVNTLELNSPE